MPTAVDSAILSSHDSLEPAFGFDISGKSWDFGNDHDDLANTLIVTNTTSKLKYPEFLFILSSAQDTLHEGGSDLVCDRSGLLGGGDTAATSTKSRQLEVP